MDASLRRVLDRLGVPGGISSCVIGDRWCEGTGTAMESKTPIDGSTLISMAGAGLSDMDAAIGSSETAYASWRAIPAPRRGELVRLFGEQLREHKSDLAFVVSWEVGKILQESLGEVQEMIDVCDFALGLSRQLHGNSMVSERPLHRLTEQWHPLGPIGVISAFNFPVAVWAWNTMIALVCGDPVVWKPSEKAPLCALACQSLFNRAIADFSDAPDGLTSVVVGDGPQVGHALAADMRLPLISATGSIPMGRAVATTVAKRLGRSLLELGGNNAMIVAPSADLALAERAIVFAAVGTCGQRCTTLRRLIVHQSIADRLLERILHAYQQLPIGDPLRESTLIGPLIDHSAGQRMEDALARAKQQGGEVHGGGLMVEDVPDGGCYVKPAVVVTDAASPILQEETFAPILYFVRYQDYEEAIAIHNNVPQGLSSSVFTGDIREAEWFCSPMGSDCGIVNVNIGPSGAEIGGAFGGEKETGGGRESGSDSWKAYMRRVTTTVNYSHQLPLAQGVQFFDG